MEWWNQVVENVRIFFNQPVTIIVSSVLTILAGAMKILSATSWGKKSVRYLKGQMEKTVKVVDDYITKMDGYTTQLENKVKELETEYHDKVVAVYSQYEILEKGVIDSLKTIPNLKVKKAVEEFETKYEETKVEIGLYVQNTYNDFENAVEVIRNEKNNEIEHLRNEIDKVKELIEQMPKVEETSEEVHENGNEEQEG